MFSDYFPTVKRIASGRRRYLLSVRWRTATWWPSDSSGAKQRSVLRLLAFAHAQRLDPIVLLENYASEHRGAYRRRLLRLVRRLKAKTSLIDALEQTPELLSDQAVLAIRLGSQSGTLSQTYTELLSQESLPDQTTRSMLLQSLIYLAVLAASTSLIIFFLTVFITPTLQHLLNELKMEPTPSFKILEEFSNLVSRYFLLIFLGFLFLGWLAFSSWTRRYFRRFLALRWMRSAAWDRSAGLLRLFALVIEAGRPLPAAISTLARYHFDRNMRKRLLFVRNEVEQGADVWQSLVEAKILGHNEALALAHAPTHEVCAWTMQRLAKKRVEWINRRQATVVSLLQPTTILLFACLVSWIGVAIIGTLIHYAMPLMR